MLKYTKTRDIPTVIPRHEKTSHPVYVPDRASHHINNSGLHFHKFIKPRDTFNEMHNPGIPLDIPLRPRHSALQETTGIYSAREHYNLQMARAAKEAREPTRRLSNVTIPASNTSSRYRLDPHSDPKQAPLQDAPRRSSFLARPTQDPHEHPPHSYRSTTPEHNGRSIWLSTLNANRQVDGMVKGVGRGDHLSTLIKQPGSRAQRTSTYSSDFGIFDNGKRALLATVYRPGGARDTRREVQPKVSSSLLKV